MKVTGRRDSLKLPFKTKEWQTTKFNLKFLITAGICQNNALSLFKLDIFLNKGLQLKKNKKAIKSKFNYII